MITANPTLPPKPGRTPDPLPGLAPDRAAEPFAFCLGPLGRLLLIPACLLLVAAPAVLDYRPGPSLSFGVFYLIPAAACAWWGGFPHGVLLATAGTLAWCAVDLAESPEAPPAAAVWNGVTR